eukprot:g17336.t1
MSSWLFPSSGQTTPRQEPSGSHPAALQGGLEPPKPLGLAHVGFHKTPGHALLKLHPATYYNEPTAAPAPAPASREQLKMHSSTTSSPDRYSVNGAAAVVDPTAGGGGGLRYQESRTSSRTMIKGPARFPANPVEEEVMGSGGDLHDLQKENRQLQGLLGSWQTAYKELETALEASELKVHKAEEKARVEVEKTTASALQVRRALLENGDELNRNVNVLRHELLDCRSRLHEQMQEHTRAVRSNQELTVLLAQTRGQLRELLKKNDDFDQEFFGRSFLRNTHGGDGEGDRRREDGGKRIADADDVLAKSVMNDALLLQEEMSKMGSIREKLQRERDFYEHRVQRLTKQLAALADSGILDDVLGEIEIMAEAGPGADAVDPTGGEGREEPRSTAGDGVEMENGEDKAAGVFQFYLSPRSLLRQKEWDGEEEAKAIAMANEEMKAKVYVVSDKAADFIKSASKESNGPQGSEKQGLENKEEIRAKTSAAVRKAFESVKSLEPFPQLLREVMGRRTAVERNGSGARPGNKQGIRNGLEDGAAAAAPEECREAAARPRRKDAAPRAKQPESADVDTSTPRLRATTAMTRFQQSDDSQELRPDSTPNSSFDTEYEDVEVAPQPLGGGGHTGTSTRGDAVVEDDDHPRASNYKAPQLVARTRSSPAPWNDVAAVPKCKSASAELLQRTNRLLKNLSEVNKSAGTEALSGGTGKREGSATTPVFPTRRRGGDLGGGKKNLLSLV